MQFDLNFVRAFPFKIEPRGETPPCPAELAQGRPRGPVPPQEDRRGLEDARADQGGLELQEEALEAREETAQEAGEDQQAEGQGKQGERRRGGGKAVHR